MVEKAKNKVLVAVLAVMLVCCSLFAFGITARAEEEDDTQPSAPIKVTLTHTKAENAGTQLYAKFGFQDAEGNQISVPQKTNAEWLYQVSTGDTEQSFHSKVRFDLQNEGAFKGVCHFPDLVLANGNWNFHLGYDSIGEIPSVFMVTSNSVYTPVAGDMITLEDGLHIMENDSEKADTLKYTPYVLDGYFTVVYTENMTLEILPNDKAYSVTFPNAKETVVVAGEATIAATVREGYKGENDKLAVTYTSSDETIATVDENGKVTGVAPGTVTVTATAGGKSGVYELTVNSAISLDKSELPIKVGATEQLTATVALSDATVQWSSSDESVATVDENGLVTGVAAGTATITAQASNGNTAECAVTVAAETEISVSPTEKTITMAETVSLTAVINDGTQINWSLSDSDMGTLSQTTGAENVFTPQKNGTVTVTATAGETTTKAECEITILSTIALDKTMFGLEKDTDVTLTATVRPSDIAVTWSSSDTSIATVDADGKVSGVGNGVVTITATTADGEYAEADIEVFTYETVKFTKIAMRGDHDILVYGYTPTGTATNFEGQKNGDQFAAFFDNVLFDGKSIKEHDTWNNINIHVYGDHMEFCIFNSANEAQTVTSGTKLTFKAGCVLPTFVTDHWELSKVRVEKETEFILLSDNTWAEIGETAFVTDIGAIEEDTDSYEFRITFNTIGYDGATEDTVEGMDEKVKIGGYTVREINQANPDKGVTIAYDNRDMIITIAKGTVMDGKNLLDTQGHSTSVTIEEGFKLPSESVVEETYTKYYYGNMKWWSNAYVGKPESSLSLVIKSISAVEADEAGGNYALSIEFTEDVFEKTFHINGVCKWMANDSSALKLPELIDGQLTTGVKEAVWYGIKIDDKTVYHYMFETDQGNEVNQSTAVMVHFDDSKTLRIVFQASLNAGFELEKNHTLEFDAEKFYSNTGATFARDQYWTYDNGTKIWTDETTVSGVTLDKTTLTLTVGEEYKLDATVTAGIKADKSVRFTSSDSAKVTVSDDGTVKAVAAGAVTVTVTVGDKTATCSVIVSAPENPAEENNNDEGCGCGGSLTATSVLVGGVLLAIALCAIIGRRKTAE